MCDDFFGMEIRAGEGEMLSLETKLEASNDLLKKI